MDDVTSVQVVLVNALGTSIVKNVVKKPHKSQPSTSSQRFCAFPINKAPDKQPGSAT